MKIYVLFYYRLRTLCVCDKESVFMYLKNFCSDRSDCGGGRHFVVFNDFYKIKGIYFSLL